MVLPTTFTVHRSPQRSVSLNPPTILVALLLLFCFSMSDTVCPGQCPSPRRCPLAIVGEFCCYFCAVLPWPACVHLISPSLLTHTVVLTLSIIAPLTPTLTLAVALTLTLVPPVPWPLPSRWSRHVSPAALARTFSFAIPHSPLRSPSIFPSLTPALATRCTSQWSSGRIPVPSPLPMQCAHEGRVGCAVQFRELAGYEGWYGCAVHCSANERGMDQGDLTIVSELRVLCPQQPICH